MICPFCLHKKTAAYNSRPTKRRNAIWRRRRCLKCDHNFTTREVIETEGILSVIQENEQRPLPFRSAKLLLSLVKVLDHRKDDAPYWLCETIEQKLLHVGANQKGLITRADIIEVCLTVLKAFDTPGFVKYLSYYSPSFNAKALQRELKRK